MAAMICQGRGSHMALIAVAATLLLIFATLAFTQSSRNAIGVSIRSRNQSIPGPAAAQGRARCVRAYASGNPKHIIISGAPASGKGTQCQLIVDKYGVKHISTGDALRAHVRSQTELGKKAKAYMDAGDLVPDELIMSIMKEEAMHGSSGWLLDGVPRTAKQVEALRETGLIPDKVILLEVPDEVLIERCVGRLFDPETGNTYHRKYFPPPPEIAERCVQRSDDNEETLRNRLDQFRKNRQSLVDGYRGQIVSIDGNRNKEAIFQDICSAIDASGVTGGTPALS